MAGVILVISGPSGSGKSSVLAKILKKYKNAYFSISSTSREPRVGEEDGVNYHFISKEKFEKGIKKGEFLEWALVHGNYYGTSLKAIQKAYEKNKIVILDIDVQGHRIIKEKMGNLITSVFITTPNDELLIQRLTDRNTDDEQSIKKRIKNAKKEMQSINEYDYLLINDEFETVAKDFDTILKASQFRVVNTNVEKFTKLWNTK